MSRNRKSPDPHDRPEPQLVCWACQAELQRLQMVRVDDLRIHVCGDCWLEMPVAERVKIAQAFRDRAEGGVVNSLKRLLDAAPGRFPEHPVSDEQDYDDLDDDGESWKRGGR